MTIFKKLAAVAALLALTLSLTACGVDAFSSATPAGDKTYKIGIIQLVENGAFEDMKKGFKAEMEKEYGAGKVEFVEKSAQGDASNMNTIAQEMAGGGYDLVATISTPASQAFVNQKSDTPQVFIAVSQPVKAGLLSDMKKPDKNATGTQNPIPVEGIFNLAKELKPDIKTVGILYSANEVNSNATAKDAKAQLEKMGLKAVERTVSNSSEVKQTADSLAAETDAIFVPNDSLIQDAIALVVDAANAHKIPILGSSKVMVDGGALLSVAIDDVDTGAQSARLAIEVLNGKAVADVPAIAINGDMVDVNMAAAEKLGITIPQAIQDKAHSVVK
ncbi:MAG: ABC transporter substrate-binding protein [Clostridiales bacterium]|nr:ABC transporter substrate-binding protein [Clostridiales bacterium]